jgi:hypothetical protein
LATYARAPLGSKVTSVGVPSTAILATTRVDVPSKRVIVAASNCVTYTTLLAETAIPKGRAPMKPDFRGA